MRFQAFGKYRVYATHCIYYSETPERMEYIVISNRKSPNKYNILSYTLREVPNRSRRNNRGLKGKNRPCRRGIWAINEGNQGRKGYGWADNGRKQGRKRRLWALNGNEMGARRAFYSVTASVPRVYLCSPPSNTNDRIIHAPPRKGSWARIIRSSDVGRERVFGVRRGGMEGGSGGVRF